MESSNFFGAFLLLAFAATGVAQSSSFNIDCGTGNATPSAAYSAATTQAGFWNSSNLNPTPILLTDVSGVPSATVSLTIAGCNTDFFFNNTGTSGNDELLMDDIQDLSAQNQSTTWTIGPMASGTYAVTVYAWAPDFPPDSTLVTVAGGSLGSQTLAGSTAWTGFVVGQTHVQDIVTLNAGANIVVTADGAANNFGSLNGMQIERLAPGPVVYCTGKLNSAGCVPSIGSSGAMSASAASGFLLTASNELNNQVGLVLYSEFGRDAAPFGSNGFLCVRSPARRSKGFNSGGNPPPGADCSGVFSIDFNTFARGLLGAPPSPAAYLWLQGQVVTAQFWGRDPGIPAPDNFSLSNGIEFTVAP